MDTDQIAEHNRLLEMSRRYRDAFAAFEEGFESVRTESNPYNSVLDAWWESNTRDAIVRMISQPR